MTRDTQKDSTGHRPRATHHRQANAVMVSSRVKGITALTLAGRSSDTTSLVPQILPKACVSALANTTYRMIFQYWPNRRRGSFQCRLGLKWFALKSGHQYILKLISVPLVYLPPRHGHPFGTHTGSLERWYWAGSSRQNSLRLCHEQPVDSVQTPRTKLD